MKQLRHIIYITLTGMATGLQAGSLTVPNTFSAGTPAVATEVNSNFEATKNAVDDNDTRITSNAGAIGVNATAIGSLDSSKQNRVNGACASGYAIRAINADGSVVCELDNDSGGDIQAVTAAGGLSGGGSSGSVSLSLSSGSVSINGFALTPHTYTGCVPVFSSSFYYSTSSTTSSCAAYAPVNLPHGAYADSMTCHLFDNDPVGNSNVRLLRRYNTSSITYALFETANTINSSVMQTLTDNTPNVSNLINNSTYNYMLVWYGNHNTSTVGSNAAFYNCVIDYHF